MRYFKIPILAALFFVASCSNDETAPGPDLMGQNDQDMEQNDPGMQESTEEVLPPIEERLQLIINDKIGVGSDGLVGVSVSIRVGSEERWLLTGGRSVADQPIESDMRFGIASITKTAIAATILKLEDEGILTTEDTIGDWLTIDIENVDSSITIFQLLSHFTGVEEYLANPNLWPDVEGDLQTPIPPLDIVEYIGTPINVPGVEHDYTNSNYLLLGLIIEAATQQTVGEVLREKFWGPLQLNNIYFSSNETVVGPIAAPWRDTDGNGTLEDITDQFGPAYHSVFYCAAGIFSTASDLSMWAQHLYNGNAISESARTRMLSSYVIFDHPVFKGYGLGVRRNIYAGRTMWGHTGGMRGYGTAMFYDPISKVSIAMLNNQSRSTDGPTLRFELLEELLSEVFSEL